MSENKRIGRETELRKKVKETADRFEGVFGKPLSPKILNEFLDHSEKHNRNQFLVDKIGVLSDADVHFLRSVLKENVSDKSMEEESEAPAGQVDIDDLDDLDDSQVNDFV